MKVVQLISTNGFYGAERAVLLLSQAVRKLGIEVECIALEGRAATCGQLRANLTRTGLPCQVIPYSSPFFGKSFRGLIGRLRELGPDLVHCHGYKADILGWLVTRRLRVPCMCTAHNWTGATFALRLYAKLDRFAMKRLEHVVTVSRALEISIRKSGIRAERISTIWNGIDLATCSSAPRVLDRNTEFTICIVSRLTMEKGFGELLDAIKAVSASTAVRLLIAGEGPDRLEIEQIIASLRLGGVVELLGFQNDVRSLLAKCDLFVLPSWSEGTPISILEAFASGVPVVATAVGGIPEMIQSYRNGILVQPHDSEALAGAITLIASDQQLARQLASQGKRDIVDSFDIAATARSYQRVYERLLNSTKQSPGAMNPLAAEEQVRG